MRGCSSQGGIGVSGGDGNGGRGGLGGAIALATSTGSLRVIGGLDASGSTSTQSFAGAGGRVTVTARGPVLIVGQIGVQGANGAFGGSAGRPRHAARAVVPAPVRLRRAPAATARSPARPAARGAVIDIGTAGAARAAGSLSVAGGNGNGTGPGGGGGAAIVAAVDLRCSAASTSPAAPRRTATAARPAR